MGQEENQNSFIIQGSILAMAGILVRIIGLIYRIPLTNILGDQGNDYYSTAFDIYAVLLLLSSQSMPLAVSKIVSERLGKKEYKNAHKVFKGAVIYATVLGVLFGAFAFFGADQLATVFFKTPPAARALRVLAPTITIVCILGVLRGYFQGMGNMVPTALSQVFEQIVNAIVSVVAAYELSIYGLSVARMSQLSGKEADVTRLSWAAAGGTLGTLSGALLALMIMIFILFKRYGSIRRTVVYDVSEKNEHYLEIMKAIILTVTPVLISTAIYNISNLLDNPIYKNISELLLHIPSQTKSVLWGMYSAKYRTLTTMPIAIAAALSTAIVPSLVKSYVLGHTLEIRKKISLCLKFAMMIAFPCGIGLTVLGGPVNEMLFKNNSSEIVVMMIFSVFTVVAFSLSTISNAILQGIDKLKVPIHNSVFALIIHLILLPVLLIVFKMGIYAVIVGDILFGATISALNAYAIKRYLHYRQEFYETFLKPFACSVLMGIGAYGTYRLANQYFSINTFSTIISIIASSLIYIILLIRTKTLKEEELLWVPKGQLIIRLCKKIHLL